MARSDRISHTPLEARLKSEPRRFGFFQAVRLLERLALAPAAGRRGRARVGEEVDPRQRIAAFRAAAHLSFPPSEIDNLTEDPSNPPDVAVNFMGLTGPSGVLPQHYTITLLRELRRRNTALRDFFDIFNHRLIAFFYRAWAKYRIPISVERGGAEAVDGATFTLRALIGFATDHLAPPGVVTQHALLHYSGLLAHLPRNEVSLERLLIDYFRLPIKVNPFQGRWLAIPAHERSRLPGSGRRHQFASLGVDAVIGAGYWDVQGSFSIEIGPIGYADFVTFMPNGSKLGELADLARLYVGPPLGFRVGLRLRHDEVPLLRLDAGGVPGPRLGWNTWLRHYPDRQDADDAAWDL
ncbi:MAG: type VI secretion system baseplate subunit TssG [Thiohalocapsa sp.]